MTNNQLIALAKEARALFRVHPAGESENRPDGWVSFNTDNWDTENPLYQVFSGLINDSGLDEESAYSWTYGALGEIIDATPENDEELDQDAIIEVLQGDDRGLIYNYDIVQWLAKGNNWTIVDEINEEMGGENQSIISQINTAYAISQERQSTAVFQ